jgi:SHS2 domain-containing protein
MKNGGFAEVAHTADLALKVWGENFYALINFAALGMYDLMGVEFAENSEGETEIRLRLSNQENILVDFLSELLYFCEEKKIYLSAFTYKISDDQILINAESHVILNHNRSIKAVTYHALEIAETEDRFETTLTFDV